MNTAHITSFYFSSKSYDRKNESTKRSIDMFQKVTDIIVHIFLSFVTVMVGVKALR